MPKFAKLFSVHVQYKEKVLYNEYKLLYIFIVCNLLCFVILSSRVLQCYLFYVKRKQNLFTIRYGKK